MFQYGLHVLVCCPDVFSPVICNKVIFSKSSLTNFPHLLFLIKKRYLYSLYFLQRILINFLLIKKDIKIIKKTLIRIITYSIEQFCDLPSIFLYINHI